ncbi:MAG: twin-arginine translocase subunit TatC, partial [Verrucomicrobiota bacterium]
FILLTLKLSFFSGVILTFPFLLYFSFQFILPGLREVEKKAVIPGALIGFVLFLVGVAFAYFLAAPVALKFFYTFELERISNIDPTKQAMEKPVGELNLVGIDGTKFPPVEESEESNAESADGELSAATRQEIRKIVVESLATIEASNIALRYDETRGKVVIVQTKGATSTYQIGEYIAFLARLMLVFGISFQLPVVVSILVKLELLTARVMRTTRVYAWIIILVASAILTPPDLITLGLLAGPMIILYEICIIIASFIERRREKREMAEEKARRSRLEELYSKPADELSEEEKAEIHRAEIEQYEKEHAHLFDEESGHDSGETVAREGGLHGDGHEDDYDYEADHAYMDEWHNDHHHHENDPHHGEEDHTPVQDWPDRDKAEKEESSEEQTEARRAAGGTDSESSEVEDPTFEDDGFHDDDVCAPSGTVIDINYATEEELMTLPGIGPKLAASIIQYRPFSTFDELEMVPGLSQEKINAMVDRLMLG